MSCRCMFFQNKLQGGWINPPFPFNPSCIYLNRPKASPNPKTLNISGILLIKTLEATFKPQAKLSISVASMSAKDMLCVMVFVFQYLCVAL